MANSYTKQELDQLHDVLYDILGEFIRVCDLLQIPYFLQGGSAMGAFFENAILPWDDDIDVGMKREDYEHFLQEAPKHLRSNYFLQWIGSDPHFPMPICKLRKNNTLFLEKDCALLNIHHGIFIDIMPYDRVPENYLLQKIHRYLLGIIYRCLESTEIWRWDRYYAPSVPNPILKGFCMSTVAFLAVSLLSKERIFNIYSGLCKVFNKSTSTIYNQAKESFDHISEISISNIDLVDFGPLKVAVPSDLETYLRHHYGDISRHIPDEKKTNHYPLKLSFNCAD